MDLYRDLDDLPDRFRGGAVSIGNFDGVHKGHARIVERLVAMARELGGPAVVFTFDPHPARVLRPEQPPEPLCWTGRKAELLSGLGVDAVVAYPVTREFLQLEAREFFDRLVRGRLAARGMVEGRSFFFGHNRSGNVEVLGELCREAGIRLEVVEPVMIGGQAASSSRVRALIIAGEVGQARQMLSQPYRIRGTVVRGRGRGRQIGFPTANLERIDTLLPAEGIYAGMAHLPFVVRASARPGPVETANTGPERAEARTTNTCPAAISIGGNPTFNEGALKVEVFVLDFQGDLYGQTLVVDFLAHLRNIRRFASAQELIAQMGRDVEETRKIAEQNLNSEI